MPHWRFFFPLPGREQESICVCVGVFFHPFHPPPPTPTPTPREEVVARGEPEISGAEMLSCCGSSSAAAAQELSLVTLNYRSPLLIPSLIFLAEGDEHADRQHLSEPPTKAKKLLFLAPIRHRL